MASLSAAIQTVRFKVGNPDERVLSEEDYIRAILEVDDELVTELNLSSQGWLVPRYLLTVNSSQDIYPVQAADFGRGQYLVTVKDSDPYHNTRMVKFVDEPDLIMYFGGGDLAPSGVEHSALAAAIVNIDGVPAIRLAPKPSMTATYQVVYEPTVSRPQSKSDRNFRLEMFDGYLTDRAARKLLPYADLSPDAYGRTASTLDNEIQRGDLRFRMYKQSDRQNINFRVVPYGAARWRRRNLL